MSGKNVLHLPGTFPLTGAAHLPLTGADHPLRREFSRWLGWSNGIALALGLLAFAIWYFASHAKPREAPVAREVKIVRYADLGVPPSISRAQVSVPQIKIAQAVAPPSIGVPEPVPDVQAKAATIATQEEMQEALAPVTVGDMGAGGTEDSLVVAPVAGEIEESPSPEDFIVPDEQPERLRMDTPVYPEMAQSAKVEGTVLIQVLVGKDGQVKRCLVKEGHEMLRETALAAARSAVFKPAMIQNKPIEIWVMLPITFKLPK